MRLVLREAIASSSKIYGSFYSPAFSGTAGIFIIPLYREVPSRYFCCMNGHIQLTFPNVRPEQQEMLIAHLAEAGYDGFEETTHELKAYINADKYDNHFLKELAYKYQLTYTEERIAPQNWNAVWESNFQPVIVDDFALIRACFHPPVPGIQHDIIITPKMSFGTGHHATTWMMVQQMRELDMQNKTVFDFGTGTGILAILAEKQGAGEVLAIDNDEWSIVNAAENITANHCRHITLQQAVAPPAGKQFEILLANINKNVILDNLEALTAMLPGGGTLLLSGLLEEDERAITGAARSFSLRCAGKATKNGWICLKMRH